MPVTFSTSASEVSLKNSLKLLEILHLKRISPYKLPYKQLKFTVKTQIFSY